jgi:hypothetical protein
LTKSQNFILSNYHILIIKMIHYIPLTKIYFLELLFRPCTFQFISHIIVKHLLSSKHLILKIIRDPENIFNIHLFYLSSLG